MTLIGNNAIDLVAYADLTALAGLLTGALVELFQNDVTPTRATLIGSYTVATYTGYANEAITWLAPSISDDGVAEIVGTVAEFRPTGSGVANNIYGAYVTTSGGALIGAVRFDNAPVPMAGVNDSILVTIRIRTQIGGLLALVS